MKSELIFEQTTLILASLYLFLIAFIIEVVIIKSPSLSVLKKIKFFIFIKNI